MVTSGRKSAKSASDIYEQKLSVYIVLRLRTYKQVHVDSLNEEDNQASSSHFFEIKFFFFVKKKNK